MKIFLLLFFLILLFFSCKKDILYCQENVNTQSAKIHSVFSDGQEEDRLPWIVYRADERNPEEIKNAGGFKARYITEETRPEYSLFRHIRGDINMTTAFISTTENINFAVNWLANCVAFYIYSIRPTPNFISAQGTLRNYNPFPEQKEWAAVDSISWGQVISWYFVQNGRIRSQTMNLDYVPDPALVSRPTYFRADIAGFPQGHPASSQEPWSDQCSVCINSTESQRIKMVYESPEANECSSYRKKDSTCFDVYNSVQDYLKVIYNESPKTLYMDIPAVRSVFSYGEINFTNKLQAINKDARLINIQLPEQGIQGSGASQLISEGNIVNNFEALRNTPFADGFDAATLYKYKEDEDPLLLLFKNTQVAFCGFDQSTASVKKIINTFSLIEVFPFFAKTPFSKGFDAVFSIPGTNMVYFIKGNQGAFADFHKGKLFKINNLTSEWAVIDESSVFADGVDAAFCVKSPYAGADYWVFFFKGRRFKAISFELTKNAVSVNQVNKGGGDILSFKAFQQAVW